MGIPTTKPAQFPEPARDGQRLESWKEIASHLKRDVRTVQRWERREGLPVHRHLHSERGTVYTTKAELDAWWNNRRPRIEKQESEKQEAVRGRKWWLWPIVAVVIAAAAAAVISLRVSRRPPLAFQQRDWVLISSFENLSREPIFDGTLEYALERELSNSAFVNVVPRERIDDTLRLMRKPLDTRIDLALGREICLRDGGIRALLTGRIEKLDTTYLLSAELVEPARGRVVASLSEEAAGQRDVISVLRRLSNRIRHTLGEKLSSIQQSAEKLEKVTTPSLHALRLFSIGSALKEEANCDDAALLFEQALAEDPDFATAHMFLAYCYSNMGRHKEAAPHYKRAFALAGSTSDSERYFILGGYYARFLNDYEKAKEEFEVLVRMYPDHFFGVDNLATMYEWLGRPAQAIPYRVRIAELRPNDFPSNYDAWDLLNVIREDPEKARQFLTRAQRLSAADGVSAQFPWRWADLQYVQVDEYLREAELVKALQELETVARKLDSVADPPRTQFLFNTAYRYQSLGRLHTAEQYAQQMPDTSRHFLLAVLAEFRGDRKAFRQELLKQLAAGGPTLGPGTAARMARAGLISDSAKLLSSPRRKNYDPVQVQIARGELALARGRWHEAIETLRAAFALSRTRGEVSMWASGALAHALEKQGDVLGAVQVLEQGLRENPAPEALDGIAEQKLRLLQLYRKLGREKDARTTEAELSKLLAVADPDHPIFVQLRSQNSAVAQSSR